jgi:hypothetical protein
MTTTKTVLSNQEVGAPFNNLNRRENRFELRGCFAADIVRTLAAPTANFSVRRNPLLAIIISLFFSFVAYGQTKKVSEVMNKIEPLPRDLEIQLALSALPPHLRDSATVYALNPAKGFEVARKGTNGFHALVARTGDDMMRGTWPLKEYRNDILYPISFDKAGAKAQMQVFFDIAQLQAKGTPPGELKKTIQNRYKTKYYKSPERAGISYMLSPILRTYTDPDENDNVVTANIPHVMYYAPDVSNEDVGGAKPGSPYPFVILHGSHGYSIQVLGKMEAAEITKEYEGMLTRLCEIKEEWCLPKSNVNASSTHGNH